MSASSVPVYDCLHLYVNSNPGSAYERGNTHKNNLIRYFSERDEERVGRYTMQTQIRKWGSFINISVGCRQDGLPLIKRAITVIKSSTLQEDKAMNDPMSINSTS
jgi:hypothetical protein